MAGKGGYMPIKPENKKLYPKNWKEIRRQILERANNKCEFCGIENYSEGYRTKEGDFIKSEGMQQEADELIYCGWICSVGCQKTKMK